MSDWRQLALEEALKAAATIGIDFANMSSFEKQARRTGVLLFSSSCAVRKANGSLWGKGSVAVTSNVVLIRAEDPWIGIAGRGTRLNIPSKTFRFKNLEIHTLTTLIPKSGITFSHGGATYQMVDMDRRRFTDAIGASRRY